MLFAMDISELLTLVQSLNYTRQNSDMYRVSGRHTHKCLQDREKKRRTKGSSCYVREKDAVNFRRRSKTTSMIWCVNERKEEREK